MADEPTSLGQPYEIVSIKRAAAPPSGDNPDWYDYEIAQGEHRIHGCRQGKLKAVTLAVEEIVEQLNERRFGKRGRPAAVQKSSNNRKT